MGNIQFISRSDDLGSSHSANRAIDLVTKAGFIKNVSVMACGPAVEEAAGLLAGRKDICFGMHTTLNAEWDRVKWGPVLPAKMCPGLVDENGAFLPDPSCFVRTKPSVEVIMAEVSAQLDRLCKLGFDIRYIDSHMFPEMYIEGLDEAMEAFIRSKGLLDHMYYYNFTPTGMDIATLASKAGLEDIPDGQYLLITHPSQNTPEMRMTGNATVPGEVVATQRSAETAILTDAEALNRLAKAGIRGIRYDEAVFNRRLTRMDMIRLLSGGK